MRTFLAVLLSAGAALASDPAVTETLVEQPYAVGGASAAQVRAAILASRPAGEGGRFDALTLWNVTYHYQDVDVAGFCAAGEVTVQLRITVQLPVLRQVPEATRALFGGYLSALRRHEDGHVEIDRAVAGEVAQAVRDVTAQPTCALLADEVRRTVARVLDEGRARNAAYDARTRHGAAQGATYPPVSAR